MNPKSKCKHCYMAVSSKEQFCSWCGILISDEQRKELKDKKCG
jgi:predicted nucleic acid-binding Zn ribbon protein